MLVGVAAGSVPWSSDVAVVDVDGDSRAAVQGIVRDFLL